VAPPNHKRIPALEELRQEKKPRASPQEDWWAKTPAWRISRLEMSDPFGWHELNEETLHEVRGKLGQFESMTLNEIFVTARSRNHSVQVANLCSKAKQRLVELKLVVDEIYSLRLSGEQRIWCTLFENILTILWWDPKHQVCPAPKKHT
jgi:hypothetical protein